MEESVADLERQVVLLKRVLASFDDTDVFVALPEGPNGLGRSLECDISAELKPFFRRLFSSDVLESPNCNFGESTGDVTLEVIGLGDEIAHAIVFVETAPEENAPPGVVLPPCTVCKVPKAAVGNVGDNGYCKDCFKCSTCLVELKEQDFVLFGQQLFCQAHSLRCHGCGKSFVDGKVVTALSKRFHMECFSCRECKRTFNKGEAVYVGDDGQPYCEEHAPESSEEEGDEYTYSTSDAP